MNKAMTHCMMAALCVASAGRVVAGSDTDSAAPGGAAAQPPMITLVSAADPACDGGFGFRRVADGIQAGDAFVVPDDARFVAAEIRWHARADAFTSPADRVVLEVGAHAEASGNAPMDARAIVNGTRVGAGEAEGERRYRSGIAFEPGSTLCGHLRTRNTLADAHPARAGAVIHGRLAEVQSHEPRHTVAMAKR